MDTKDSIILTYENILNGKQKAFSPYFFHPSHRIKRITTLLQYLIEEKLGYSPEEALEKLTLQDVKKYKLTCLFKYIDKPVEFSKENVQHLVYYAYPDLPQPSVKELALQVYADVLAGKRKTFPKNYFLNGELGEERAIICFKHLCEDILKLTPEEIIETFARSSGLKVLSKYKLKIIMNVLFFSTVDLLETAYPGLLNEHA
jgi:hypothetical protein